jgi:CheY-like chemotaxis protein
MPVLCGLEATRLIKATQVTRESRVIAYTGNGSIPPPLERWFVAIVSKPSPPDVVLAAVQNAVSMERRHRSCTRPPWWTCGR